MFRDLCPRMSEAEEEGFVKKLIPNPAIKTLAEAVQHGLAQLAMCVPKTLSQFIER
jgi:hypothetical protein